MNQTSSRRKFHLSSLLVMSTKAVSADWFFSTFPQTQPIQKAPARAVIRTPKHSHIIPALKSLHWLKIKQCIQYKLISITHNRFYKSELTYLRNLINIKPTGKTCISDHLCLSLSPLTSKLKFSDHTFRNCSPCPWNSLPTNLRSLTTPTITYYNRPLSHSSFKDTNNQIPLF